MNPEGKMGISHTDITGGIGYKMSSGLYFGGTYTWMQEEYRTETAGSCLDMGNMLPNTGPRR